MNCLAKADAGSALCRKRGHSTSRSQPRHSSSTACDEWGCAAFEIAHCDEGSARMMTEVRGWRSRRRSEAEQEAWLGMHAVVGSRPHRRRARMDGCAQRTTDNGEWFEGRSGPWKGLLAICTNDDPRPSFFPKHWRRRRHPRPPACARRLSRLSCCRREVGEEVGKDVHRDGCMQDCPQPWRERDQG